MYEDGDVDVLAALGGYPGGAVGGVDFVGAAPPPMVLNAAAYRAIQQQPRLNFAPVQAAVQEAGMKALALGRKVAHDRRLRNAALAGYVPQCEVPCSTTATVAGGGALSLTAIPGIPCRPTKWNVEPAIASFFTISGIVMARLSVLAGGTGGVPATRWLPTANQTPIDNPFLGAGSPIVVTGTNVDIAAHLFLSTWDVIDMTPAHARLT